MSSQRFQRAKIVRQLVNLETELSAWVKILDEQARLDRPNEEKAQLVQKAQELWVLAYDIHTLADRAQHMPAASRGLRLRDHDVFRP